MGVNGHGGMVINPWKGVYFDHGTDRYRYNLDITSQILAGQTNSMDITLTPTYAGWWFGTFFISHILGMASSQLTFIFFRGVVQPPTSMYLFCLFCHQWQYLPSTCYHPVLAGCRWLLGTRASHLPNRTASKASAKVRRNWRNDVPTSNGNTPHNSHNSTNMMIS